MVPRSWRTSGSFGVIGVDRPAVDRFQRAFQVPRLVQRVGVDLGLEVVLVGDLQARVDGGGRRPPVLVELQADRTVQGLLDQHGRLRAVALAELAHVHGDPLEGIDHPLEVEGAGRIDPHRLGSRSPADHGGDTDGQQPGKGQPEQRRRQPGEDVAGREARCDQRQGEAAPAPVHTDVAGLAAIEEVRERDARTVRLQHQRHGSPGRRLRT